MGNIKSIARDMVFFETIPLRIFRIVIKDGTQKKNEKRADFALSVYKLAGHRGSILKAFHVT